MHASFKQAMVKVVKTTNLNIMREVFFIAKAVIRPGINLMGLLSDPPMTAELYLRPSRKSMFFFCPEIFLSVVVVLAFKGQKDSIFGVQCKCNTRPFLCLDFSAQ